MKLRHLIALFVPALFIVGIALFIRVVQYEPQFPEPKEEETDGATEALSIPIFPDDPIIGSKRAPITLIAFEDFGCEACSAQSDIFEQLITKHPNRIKVIWKGLPVTQFPHSTERAQRYGYCANKQGEFDLFKSYAFANITNLSDNSLRLISEQMTELNKTKLEECVDSVASEQYIKRVEQVARILQIQAVPAVFYNGSQVLDPGSVEGWETLLGL